MDTYATSLIFWIYFFLTTLFFSWIVKALGHIKNGKSVYTVYVHCIYYKNKYENSKVSCELSKCIKCPAYIKSVCGKSLRPAVWYCFLFFNVTSFKSWASETLWQLEFGPANCHLPPPLFLHSGLMCKVSAGNDVACLTTNHLAALAKLEPRLISLVLAFRYWARVSLFLTLRMHTPNSCVICLVQT